MQELETQHQREECICNWRGNRGEKITNQTGISPEYRGWTRSHGELSTCSLEKIYTSLCVGSWSHVHLSKGFWKAKTRGNPNQEVILQLTVFGPRNRMVDYYSPKHFSVTKRESCNWHSKNKVTRSLLRDQISLLNIKKSPSWFLFEHPGIPYED